MLLRILVASTLIISCGGTKQEPASSGTEPSPAITPEECTKLGGQVRGDIGDGQIKCAEGERELGRVATGIEGGVCCAKQ